MKTISLDASPVFQRNWEAIHAKNEDGSRKWRYIINTGSSRSSKTYSLIDCYWLYCMSNRNKRLTVWRDTKKSCKDTVLNDALKHFKSTGRHDPRNFNITDSIFKYNTGSTFEIHGTDDELTVHGLTQDAAWGNEPYKWSRDVFDQIDQRTADFILLDWNPREAHWIEDLMKDPRTIVIHSTFKDNPFCPEESRTKILSYQTVSQCRLVVDKLLEEKEANEYDVAANDKLFNRADIIELSRCRENERKKSASAYKWSVYGLGEEAELPNRIYNWQECSIQQYLDLETTEYFYSDWGAQDPWAVGRVKYYDGALYIREVNYESENIMRSKMTLQEIEQIRSNEEGIVTWAFGKWGIPQTADIICDTNRRMKIIALREAGWEYAVGLTTKETGTGKTAIVDGIDLLNNLPVYFTSDSININREQKNYSRKVDRTGTVLEEAEDFYNHHMDGIRYVASFLQAQGIINII